MRKRDIALTLVGVAQGIGSVVAAEIQVGNGRCLVSWHDWWECDACRDREMVHKMCRRCGAER